MRQLCSRWRQSWHSCVCVCVCVCVCMCVIFFSMTHTLSHTHTHTHTCMHTETHNYSLFLFQLLGESIWLLLLLLLHSGHHSQTQNGRFCCIMSRRYCVVCMDVWMDVLYAWRWDTKPRDKLKKTVCLTHCSSTTPTEWRQQNKKKIKNTCFSFTQGSTEKMLNL